MSFSDRMGTATFIVTAARCPQLLCRLLGLFAQQDRVIQSLAVEARPRGYHAAITIAGIDGQRAEIIEHKMRAIVSVRTVKLRLG
jgi:acetolactate synthase small subunit